MQNQRNTLGFNSIIDEISTEKLVEQFFQSRNSKFTRENYERHIRLVIGDPIEFVNLAAKNPKMAKFKLIDWITTNKEKKTLGGSTMFAYLVRAKSLLDYAEITLPWKSIRSLCPKALTADEKAPSYEALRKVYELADIRMKTIIGIFLSGCRVGAFDYFKKGDLTEIEVNGSKVGRLVVYAGEPDQYISFLTPETMTNISEYFSFRERYGEVLNEKSPLVRNSFDFSEKNKVPRPISRATVQRTLSGLWEIAGYPSNQRNWGVCHGFRKYSETRLCNSGMKYEDGELVLEHKLRYCKAGENYLIKEFVKAMKGLYVTPVPQLEKKIALIIKEKEDIQNEYFLSFPA